MNLQLNLNLADLYNALDDNGKKVMLDQLTKGVSEGFVRDMLIAQWEGMPASEKPTNQPAIS